MMVRRQYRGCFKGDISLERDAAKAVEAARVQAAQLIEKGSLLLASLFSFESMCFLYCELLDETVRPHDFLGPLEPFLEIWPKESGKTAWVPMTSVYYHSVPGRAKEWEKDRIKKTRVGRIAFLKPEKYTSYIYWHKALVDEGVFAGDKYQFISLHQLVLFSYFEEPKEMVNIRGVEMESKVIHHWREQLPETHFEREKTGGTNFLVIPALFSVGRSDL